MKTRAGIRACPYLPRIKGERRERLAERVGEQLQPFQTFQWVKLIAKMMRLSMLASYTSPALSAVSKLPFIMDHCRIG